MHIPQAASAARHPARSDDVDVRSRLRAEFAEMPGLKLTLPQASRLFNLKPGRCQDLLRRLVQDGDLSTDGTAFARPVSR